MSRVSSTALTRFWLVLAIALLPVLSGIAGGIHLLLERHQVCRAHGEFVHATQDCATPAADSNSPTRPSARSDEDGPRPGSDDDEHCQVVLLTRASFPTWSPGDGHALISVEEISSAVCHRLDAAPSIAQIVLAPKHSPPV